MRDIGMCSLLCFSSLYGDTGNMHHPRLSRAQVHEVFGIMLHVDIFIHIQRPKPENRHILRSSITFVKLGYKKHTLHLALYAFRRPVHNGQRAYVEVKSRKCDVVTMVLMCRPVRYTIHTNTYPHTHSLHLPYPTQATPALRSASVFFWYWTISCCMRCGLIWINLMSGL